MVILIKIFAKIPTEIPTGITPNLVKIPLVNLINIPVVIITKIFTKIPVAIPTKIPFLRFPY